MTGRRTLIAAAFAASLLSPIVNLHAQDFPVRPITLVVPFPAGSVTDSVARALAQEIHQTLAQPIVVENRPGAQGTLGAAIVAQSKPDGYTVLVGSSVIFAAKSLFKSLTFDPVANFQPVAGIASTSMLFVVASSSSVQSITDLARPPHKGQPPLTIGFGSPSGQVAVALFATVTKADPVPVSYRGIPQALTDLVGGHVECAVVDIGSGIAQMSSAKVRPIAISAATRYAGLPGVPTLEEVFPGASGSLETIIGMMVPSGTPQAIVSRLDDAFRAAIAKPEVRARFDLLHVTPSPLGPEQLAERIRIDNPRWEALIRKAGIERE